MAKNLDEKLVDRRTVERNIQKGLLTQKDYEGYLGKLKDAEDNAETVSLEEDEPAGEEAAAETDEA